MTSHLSVLGHRKAPCRLKSLMCCPAHFAGFQRFRGPLLWRHNRRDGVSNHQLTIVYSTVYSGADQRKQQRSASPAFCEGNSLVTGEFSAQRAINAENVSHLTDDIIQNAEEIPQNLPAIRVLNESPSDSVVKNAHLESALIRVTEALSKIVFCLRQMHNLLCFHCRLFFAADLLLSTWQLPRTNATWQWILSSGW